MADLKITQLDAGAEPIDADLIESVQDVASTPVNKKTTWTQIKSFLKTYFDSLYPTKTLVSNTDSPMVIGGEISEGTNAGTFQVASITGYLRSTNAIDGLLVPISKTAEDNITIPLADTTYYIALNYNGGSPTITKESSNPYSTDKRNIPIGKIMKDGSDNVHYIAGGYHLQDGVEKLHVRAKTLRTLELDGGCGISYSGTNNFTMEEGNVFGGVNNFPLTSYDSAVTQFTPVYSDGGAGWTYGATRNTIDFANYDGGAGSLVSVGVAKYGTHWVYKHIDDNHVYVRYGEDSYSLASAEAEQPPEVPTHLTDFGILVGKIVAPQSGGSFATIQMVSDTFFTGTASSNHANQTNLDYASAGHTGFSEEDHASRHAVDEDDPVFPTDPDADRFLMWDNSEKALSWEEAGGGGGGDVVGPASATDLAIPLFDGTTGKLLKNSLVTIGATGIMNFPNLIGIKSNNQNLLRHNSTKRNTSLGYNNFDVEDCGNDNTALGGSAMNGSYMSGVEKNTAVGTYTLYACNHGTENTAVGVESQYKIDYGNYNVSVGRRSLYNATSSNHNTMIGNFSGYTQTTGHRNTGLGFYTLYTNGTGTNNIAVGYYAGKYETGSNAFYINNLDRSNTAGDKAKSIIYGQMHADAVSQILTVNATIKPLQAETASAPSYEKGAIYFDTTLNKLRVGGATAWETITSA